MAQSPIITTKRNEALNWLWDLESDFPVLFAEDYPDFESEDFDEVTERLQDFLDDVPPSDISSCLREISAVFDMSLIYAAGGRGNSSKVDFIIEQVWCSMLQEANRSNINKWSDHREEILQSVYKVLLNIPKLLEGYSHSKINPEKLRNHFQIKKTCAKAVCNIWDMLSNQRVLRLNENSKDKFVAILRRLAMQDLLDPNWNMAGSWKDIRSHLEPTIGHIAPTPADRVLDETTQIWRNARNSVSCQHWTSTKGFDAAPQEFRYFPKCSALLCPNIETKEQPHKDKHRCKKCYYYHYCGSACQAYCEQLTSQHSDYCARVSPDKVAITKAGMEAYLNRHEPLEDDEDDVRRCNACSIRSMDTEEKMKRCSKCKQVYYCSRDCQLWDWVEGGHKDACSNAM